MSRRLSLVFPYLWAAAILGLIAFDRLAAKIFAVASAAESGNGGAGAATTAGGHMMRCHEAAAAGASNAMGGLPPVVYYSSVAGILLVSFLLLERGSTKDRDEERPRFDLLAWTWLRRVISAPATRFAGQIAMVAIFVLIIAAGLFGNQLPTKNIAPLLTWTVWWCGLVLLILYAGKAWCYVCPWDAVAGWAESLRLWGPKKTSLGLGLAWPRWARNIWPATFMFVALTWIEIGFGVTMRPRATAWLALTMLGLALGSAFIFDRKSFCRYGCLVGRVSGLYALFSPVEVRSVDAGVCRSCTTKSCYRGNTQGDPCPTFQFPAVMDVNTYCISCMECVKTCEAGNIGLRLRPWGEDLLTRRRGRSDEAYLALIMLALTGFHGLTMTPAWGRLTDWLHVVLGLGGAATFTVGMTAVMVGPILAYGVLVWVSRQCAHANPRRYRDHFVRYAYGLLPIALFYHLAHNAEHLLFEGPRVLALASDPFGFEWNLFGTATWAPGPLLTMRTLWLVQVLLVIVGHVYSLWASRRAADALYADPAAARRSQLPMLAAMIAFSLMSLWLLKQPMEMRTTWM